MSNTREKMKSLLMQKGFGVEGATIAADHLIANGVTIPMRCKDCKHYDNSEGICWCHLNSKFYKWGMDWHGFPEDGFCSYGERKGNERKAD